MIAREGLDAVSYTSPLYFEIGVAALYAEGFCFVGNCDCTSVVITKDYDRFVSDGRIEHPFTRYKEIVTVNQSYHSDVSASRGAFFAWTAIVLNSVGNYAPNFKSVIGSDEDGVE